MDAALFFGTDAMLRYRAAPAAERRFALILFEAFALAATQAIVAMLFGLSRLDPVTYLGVIGPVAGVASIAYAVPAWPATLVDPTSTSRAE